MNVVNLCWRLIFLYNYYKTLIKETVVCYIGTLFMQVELGTKHPEAVPWHKGTQMFTVVISYPRNYQIRVIKLIRGSKVLNGVSFGEWNEAFYSYFWNILCKTSYHFIHFQSLRLPLFNISTLNPHFSLLK